MAEGKRCTCICLYHRFIFSLPFFHQEIVIASGKENCSSFFAWSLKEMSILNHRWRQWDLQMLSTSENWHTLRQIMCNHKTHPAKQSQPGCWSLGTGTGFSGCVVFILGDIQKAWSWSKGHGPGKPAQGVPAWRCGLDQVTSEVPSNLNSSVSLQWRGKGMRIIRVPAASP